MLGEIMAYDRTIMDCLAIIKFRKKKIICIGVTIDTNTWTGSDNELQIF